MRSPTHPHETSPNENRSREDTEYIMTAKTVCRTCRFCLNPNTKTQRGSCTAPHAARNARGEPGCLVPLTFTCRYHEHKSKPRRIKADDN